MTTSFRDALHRAFPEYPVPAGIFTIRAGPDSDRDDILQLAGTVWSHVSATTWRQYPASVFALNSKGFHYYLPGILLDSVDDRLGSLRAALIGMFDTSGFPAIFPSNLGALAGLLNVPQAECLMSWARIATADRWFEDEVQRERVTYTILLLIEAAAAR